MRAFLITKDWRNQKKGKIIISSCRSPSLLLIVVRHFLPLSLWSRLTYLFLSTSLQSSKASPSTEVSSPRNAKSTSIPTTSNPQNSRPLKPEEFQLGDKIRDACLKLIYDSLKFIHPTTTTTPTSPSTPQNHYSDSHILSTAKKIELSTYLNISNSTTDQAYKAKIRSLSLNLKDKANPALKESVLNGDIESDRLVEMLPEEMASEERRKEREELILKNLFKAKAAEAQEAETDSFQCGRCKQRKCRYYQKQTRSADEPMWVFQKGFFSLTLSWTKIPLLSLPKIFWYWSFFWFLDTYSELTGPLS